MFTWTRGRDTLLSLIEEEANAYIKFVPHSRFTVDLSVTFLKSKDMICKVSGEILFNSFSLFTL